MIKSKSKTESLLMNIPKAIKGIATVTLFGRAFKKYQCQGETPHSLDLFWTVLKCRTSNSGQSHQPHIYESTNIVRLIHVIEVIAPQIITHFRTSNFKSLKVSTITIPTQSTAISHQNKMIVAAKSAIVRSNHPCIQYPIAKLTTTNAYVFGRGLDE
mgnify:CR=1 FL=1